MWGGVYVCSHVSEGGGDMPVHAARARARVCVCVCVRCCCCLVRCFDFKAKATVVMRRYLYRALKRPSQLTYTHVSVFTSSYKTVDQGPRRCRSRVLN